MKKIILLSLLALFAFSNVQAQEVNQKVDIQWGSSWYPGKILKVNHEDGEYYVSYDGWSETSNEWVTLDRLKFEKAEKAPKKFSVGDRVEVEYGMIPEPATIVEVGENKYHIEFDKK